MPNVQPTVSRRLPVQSLSCCLPPFLNNCADLLTLKKSGSRRPMDPPAPCAEVSFSNVTGLDVHIFLLNLVEYGPTAQRTRSRHQAAFWAKVAPQGHTRYRLQQLDRTRAFTFDVEGSVATCTLNSALCRSWPLPATALPNLDQPDAKASVRG